MFHVKKEELKLCTEIEQLHTRLLHVKHITSAGEKNQPPRLSCPQNFSSFIHTLRKTRTF